MFSRRLAALLTLLAAMLIPILSVCPGEEPEFSTRIDWDEGRIVIEARVNIDRNFSPKSRYLAEQKIQKYISGVFLSAIMPLAVDSSHLVSDSLLQEWEIPETLRQLSLVGTRDKAHYTEDMREVFVRYTFPFFGESGFVPPFISHRRIKPIEPTLGFTPSRSYSGIVIYAKGEYKPYGASGLETIRPAFFPRLFDEDMNLILSKEMCDPESLKKWGMAAYTEDVDLRRYSPRIGAFPLTLVARGVYGKFHTDIILPTEEIKRILSLPDNLHLLSEGRILVILENLTP